MWRTILVGCALCALGGSLEAQGRDPFPNRPRPNRPAAKAPTPAPVVKRAPTPTPVVKRTPARPAAPKPAPRVIAAEPAAPPPVATAPRPRAEATERDADRRPVVLEPSTIRRFLTTWQPRLTASEEYLAAFRERLKAGREENAKIAADVTLAAHSTEQNRKLGPLLTVGGEQARGQRDWLAQLRANVAPAPLSVEETLRKAETVAFRTQTFSGETKSLLGKAQLNSAASGALWTDLATTGGLIVPNLRVIPGAVHHIPATQPYAVQNLDHLRAALETKQSALAGQYLSARRDWQQWLARGEDLHRRYTELRFRLPAE